MYISTDVTSTLDIPLAYIFTVTQNDLQSILFYENYILSMLLFFFFFFYKTVVWNYKKSAHQMDTHYSGGFTLSTKLFILSEKEIKLSLYDLLLINPCCHLFTTHTAVVASELY